MESHTHTDLFGQQSGGHMEINVGDVVRLKKQHPCGSSEWEVLRFGADFRLKCTGCGRQIMIARRQLEKNIKEIKTAGRTGADKEAYHE